MHSWSFTLWKLIIKALKSRQWKLKSELINSKFCWIWSEGRVCVFRALESLRTDGRNSRLWEDISLAEVIMTLEDLIDYFAPPGDIGNWHVQNSLRYITISSIYIYRDLSRKMFAFATDIRKLKCRLVWIRGFVPSLTVSGSLGKLSLPSFRVGKSSTSLLAGVEGTFTCVGWQVTLCDPIWQMTSCTCETGLLCEPAMLYQGVKKVKTLIYIACFMHQAPLTRTSLKLTARPLF